MSRASGQVSTGGCRALCRTTDALCAALVLVGVAAAQDLEFRVVADATEVEFGAPFGVVVERRWPDDATAEDWRDSDLAPLVLRSLGVDRRTEGRSIVETRRFTAHAFQVGDVEVSAPVMRVTPSDGSGMRVAIGDEVILRVRSVLPPDDVGAIELPGDLLPEPSPLGWRFGAACVAVLGLGALGLRARRRGTSSHGPRSDPAVDALAEFAAIGRAPVIDADGVQRFHVDVSTVLRRYVERRFGVRAPEMTTEEFLGSAAAAAALDATQLGTLAAFLRACDLVKFGRGASAESDRGRLLETASAFVTATRAMPEPAGGRA